MRIHVFTFCFLFLPLASHGTPLEEADPEQGKILYESYCAACHGEDGHGLVPGTPDLDHDSELFAQGWNLVFQRVRDGYQSPGSPMAMPPRGGTDLSDEELWDILAYMRDAFYSKK